jgi:hypothetical protein
VHFISPNKALFSTTDTVAWRSDVVVEALAQIRLIQMILEGRERKDHFRLKQVK